MPRESDKSEVFFCAHGFRAGRCELKVFGSGEERAGDADLEANTAIKDLCSCDPYLRSAHTLELLNAMEQADVALRGVCSG